ncbi:hypothetical protein LG307_14710 [Sutcliffiella horikoshii]
MRKRDKAILNDLNRFRCMDRDSIAELHFSKLKNPQYAANNVLLRLVRDNHIQRSTHFVPYVYFCTDSTMKKNSQKINHFLSILNVYKEMKRFEKTSTFQVEPKYSKGMCEPDIFCIFQGSPFFIEVQRTVYSEKQMKEKLNRYLDLYSSGIMTNEPWQPVERKIFPHVLILSDQRYAIDNGYPFRVLQATSISQFMKSIRPKEQFKPTKLTSSGSGKLKLNIQ